MNENLNNPAKRDNTILRIWEKGILPEPSMQVRYNPVVPSMKNPQDVENAVFMFLNMFKEYNAQKIGLGILNAE